MSTFRGFDTDLIKQVQGAGGHWLDAGTLRFFDSWGGRTWCAFRGRLYVVVESSKPPHGERLYSPAALIFSEDFKKVEVMRLISSILCGWKTRHGAQRRAEHFLKYMHDEAGHGLEVAAEMYRKEFIDKGEERA